MKTILTKDYFDYFYKVLPNYSSHRQAYEATEQLFFKQFGANKYSSYSVFKSAKARYLKNLKDGRFTRS